MGAVAKKEKRKREQTVIAHATENKESLSFRFKRSTQTCVFVCYCIEVHFVPEKSIDCFKKQNIIQGWAILSKNKISNLIKSIIDFLSNFHFMKGNWKKKKTLIFIYCFYFKHFIWEFNLNSKFTKIQPVKYACKTRWQALAL